MNIRLRFFSITLTTIILLSALMAQAYPQQKPAPAARPQTSAAATGNTPGRIAKFTGSKTIGDSNITEDDSGQIGIGTTTPTSPLTVQGMIETTLGGYKFPDGTLQTTAGLATVFPDTTLKGNGTSASPLGVAVPLKLRGGQQFGNVLEITVDNVASFGITVNGGPDGVALRAFGGTSSGRGMFGVGGNSNSLNGGFGVGGAGGDSNTGPGGTGVSAGGGDSNTGTGGTGMEAGGGRAFDTGNGGRGMRAVGGTGRGLGKSGGHGIETFPGLGENGAVNGLAGKFNGNVQVTGILAKAGGSFKIDHPLDPENKYLSHSFVESPDMKNIYDGVVSLDHNGEAVVEMPEWFGALNRDFRYLLTAIGAPMPGLFIAEEMANNRFKISGGTAGMKVSWQVTGTRQDAWANKNRIPVEEAKPERERGTYLHPEAFDKPEERGANWAQDPEFMRQIKEGKLEAKRAQQPNQ